MDKAPVCPWCQHLVLLHLQLSGEQQEEKQQEVAIWLPAHQASVSSRWQAAGMAKWPAHGFSATEIKCNILAAQLQERKIIIFLLTKNNTYENVCEF